MTGQRPAGQDLGRAFVRFPWPNPAVVAWRWRYELAAAGAGWWLLSQVGLVWTVAFGLAVTAAVVVLGPVRRRLWCVVTPHRVRTGCKHSWVHSRTGRLPMVMWTRPVRGGEQVLLWMRPGTSVDDLVDAASTLTATCWAREVVVHPDPDHGHLVRLTVVRW